ncbi:MAG: hypothetical protein ACLUR5_18595 [Eubacterium ventriosum]
MNQKNYKSGRAQYFKNNVFLPGKILEKLLIIILILTRRGTLKRMRKKLKQLQNQEEIRKNS